MLWPMKRKGPDPVAGFADAVFLVPTADLVAARNPALQESMPRAKRKSKGWGAELYDGYEGLLVRTVLLRSDKYPRIDDLPLVGSTLDAHRLLEHIGYYDQEHIVILAVTDQNRCNAIFEAAIGSTGGAGIEVKHILKIPILTGASAIIIAHNHPGGTPTPSRQDIELTEKLKASVSCIAITLLDHVIEAQGSYFSFMDHNLI